MKIILSPAKKMIVDTDNLAPVELPVYIDKTAEVLNWMKSKSKEELKAIWKCNDKIAEQNFNRLENMDLYNRLTPAVLAYEGIAFQYMAPSVFEIQQFEYLQNHLRILSAFYGILKPMDGVTPYRLEMQAKVGIGDAKNLYEYWGELLYRSVIDDSRIIINLASKEYSKCIEKYLTPQDRYITIVFCELSGDKLVKKVPMPRWLVVRRLSCFPRVRSTRKRFGLSSLWKIWICPNFRMGQPIRRSRSMCWSIPG